MIVFALALAKIAKYYRATMETTNLQDQIKKAIDDAGGITAAARALGMPRKTLEEWRDRDRWPEDDYKTKMVKVFLDHALLHPDGRLMTGN